MGARGRQKAPRPSRVTAVLSGFALLAVGVAAVQSQNDPPPLPAGTYVLRADSGELPQLLDEVRAKGGTVTGQFDSIDGAAVTLDADTASALAADGRVVSLTPDAPVSTPVNRPS